MLINFVTLKAAVVGSVLSVGAGPSGIITSEYLHTYPMEAMGETNGVGFLKDVLILDSSHESRSRPRWLDAGSPWEISDAP